MPFDDMIPFCEYFVLPYFLWFGYVAWGILYFGFRDKQIFLRLCAFLFTGMTIFLIISFVYPNGLNLRPEGFDHENIFTKLINSLYSGDTSTNVFPSLHVFNSVGAAIAFWRVGKKNNKMWMGYSAWVLAILIILSTMFIKQHSVIDVIGGIVMGIILYIVVYYLPEHKISKQ